MICGTIVGQVNEDSCVNAAGYLLITSCCAIACTGHGYLGGS